MSLHLIALVASLFEDKNMKACHIMLEFALRDNDVDLMTSLVEVIGFLDYVKSCCLSLYIPIISCFIKITSWFEFETVSSQKFIDVYIDHLVYFSFVGVSQPRCKKEHYLLMI